MTNQIRAAGSTTTDMHRAVFMRPFSSNRKGNYPVLVGFGLITIVIGSAGFIAGGTGLNSRETPEMLPRFSHNLGTTSVLILTRELAPGQKIEAQHLKTADWISPRRIGQGG